MLLEKKRPREEGQVCGNNFSSTSRHIHCLHAETVVVLWSRELFKLVRQYFNLMVTKTYIHSRRRPRVTWHFSISPIGKCFVEWRCNKTADTFQKIFVDWISFFYHYHKTRKLFPHEITIKSPWEWIQMNQIWAFYHVTLININSTLITRRWGLKFFYDLESGCPL